MARLPRLWPVSCCVTVCRWWRNSHFLLSQPCTLRLRKNIWCLICRWDEAILNLFCPLLSFCPPLIRVCNLLWRYRSCVPCPPNLFVLTYTLRSPKRFLGGEIQLISFVRAFSCSTGSITDVPTTPRIWATLFRNQGNKGYHVHLTVTGMVVVEGPLGLENFPALILDESLRIHISTLVVPSGCQSALPQRPFWVLATRKTGFSFLVIINFLTWEKPVEEICKSRVSFSIYTSWLISWLISRGAACFLQIIPKS